MAKTKATTKSVLASPAKLRAIADHLERTVREQVAELRRLADLGDGAANVMAKTAAKPKKAKAAKPRAAKKAAKKTAAKRAPKKAAKKVARRSAKAAAAPATKPAPKHQAKHQAKTKKLGKLLNRKPAWANGHDAAAL